MIYERTYVFVVRLRLALRRCYGVVITSYLMDVGVPFLTKIFNDNVNKEKHFDVNVCKVHTVIVEYSRHKKKTARNKLMIVLGPVHTMETYMSYIVCCIIYMCKTSN